MQKKELPRHKIIVQIFTGGYLANKVTYQEIEYVLAPLVRENKIDKLIIGWSLQKEIYIRVLNLAKKYHVECYLWLPVFSETGLLKPARPIKNRYGKYIEGYHLQEDENFEFYCPVSPYNLKQFIQVYEENYIDLPFHGVFLDKIRYGSFSNGIESVCACFCDRCKENYVKNQIKIEEIMKEIGKLTDDFIEYSENPFAIKSYHNAVYQFQNPIWSRFFEIKQKAITDALRNVSAYFHEKGLKVGIDVFSPFLAYFVGQNIKNLSRYADFIKPMMYRITQAPAGLPFEAECMLKETVKENLCRSRTNFCRILGCKSWEDTGFDAEFVKGELDCICSYHVPVYCGIEVNQMESVVAATPEYIRENIKILGKADIAGFVLSWNLLSAPEENIKTVFEKYYTDGR